MTTFVVLCNKMISQRSFLAIVSANQISNVRLNVTRLLTTAPEPRPWTDMPGLSSLPIIGSLHHFLPIIGSIGPIDSMEKWTKSLNQKYGPLVKLDSIFARNPMVVLFEPEHMEQVLRNENVEPRRDGFQTMDYYRMVLRNDKFEGIYGLMSAQGAEWKSIRSKVNPSMLMPHTVKLYTEPINDVADDFMSMLGRLKDDNPDHLRKRLDFEMTKWSLESIATVALGARIGCLRDDLPDDAPGAQLIKSTRDILELTYALEFGPSLWKWFATPTFKKLMATFDTQLRVSEMYIMEATEKIRNRKVPISEDEKSILEKLLEIDPKVAMVMAIDMLSAGVDTVAHQTIAILYCLAQNPDKQSILRKEIRSESSKKTYLRACIKEGMRLMPALGANLRGTTREHVVDGFLIPKGIDVIFPHEYLSKLDKYYPKATEYIPERYTVDKDDSLHHSHTNPMVSIPFGFGTRSCIGRRIAELEMETFLEKFVDNFEVSWEGPPPKRVSKSVNLFLAPFNFNIKDAN